MPEGDTIFRAARTLNTALAGKVVTKFETVLPRLARVDDDTPIVGRTIERVVASGKNLILEFSGDLHLRTHMRMNGSWHIYRPGERWRKRRDDMRIVIATADWVAVAFNVPVAEFHDEKSLARQPEMAKIGPDFLGETFDADEGLRRVRARPGEEIANVLLNQRVVAGIGNVYKSEVLFLCAVSPFRKVRDIDDGTLQKILETGETMLRRNVLPDARERKTTVGLATGNLNVYGKAGAPCPRCGTPISMKKQGADARLTFWCERCQR